MPPRSPLAPDSLPSLPVIAGVRLAATSCGIRYKTRKDLLIAEMAEGTSVAGVFTRSKTAAAPVDWSKQCANGGKARALVVNSGNANAFTGRAGIEAVDYTVEAVAKAMGCQREEVFVASTGVIGEPLPYQKIIDAVPALQTELSEDAWQASAEAIMTTDTFPKAATRSVKLGDKQVHMNGIAKGSGMIAPDMATMLAFIFTDIAVEAEVLQRMLNVANRLSFNSITVDGDTSTSDLALLFATGARNDVEPIRSLDDPRCAALQEALNSLMIELAQLIVRDGEGAQKFMSIHVKGAEHDEAARIIGLLIGNSPLVKTAIAGEDANWGRIVMAVGKTGERVDRDRLCVSIGGVRIAENGQVVEGYDEAPVNAHVKGREIDIEVDIGLGEGSATVWSCDLTHGYIDINADYRS